MGIDSMARHRCYIGVAIGSMRRFIGWRRTSFAMVNSFLRSSSIRDDLFISFLCKFAVSSALILFSVCGLLAVTGSWLMSGLYLSSSVAVGDLCMDPADFLVSQAPSNLPTDVLLYYTQCESIRSNPFTQRLRESQNAINNARSGMHIVSRISLVLFKSSGLQPKLGAVTADLNNSERVLTELTALVDCKALHHNYLSATRGLCESGLLGLLMMLVASFVAAILLTIMVWVDSHTWIYIRKRNDYAQVDEPSYVSHHQHPGAANQMHPHNHHNNSHTMSRTLPRNHNG